MGFDVVHMNVHKTFSTPHGGGGPGAGPVGVKAHLREFLPVPCVEKRGDTYALCTNRPKSIGRVGAFQGNVGILLRAYAYLRVHGRDGLAAVGQHAVLNAAYLLARLSKTYRRATASPCMHEFIVTPTDEMLAKGIKTLHVAKRLIDFGFHPPTIYFPLIVPGALMIEPTESESKEEMDAFCAAMLDIAREAEEAPDRLHQAPVTTPVRRLDETTAARKPVLRWSRPA